MKINTIAAAAKPKKMIINGKATLVNAVKCELSGYTLSFNNLPFFSFSLSFYLI